MREDRMGCISKRVAARPSIPICALVLALAVTAIPAQALGADGRATAKNARTVSLSETAHMETSSKEIPGSEVSESGHATGTYNVPITAGVTIHAKHIAAVVSILLKGGTITASADANFIESGSGGAFHGTLKITRGTGTYRHASGQLAFNGGFNRVTLKMWVV
ncbi:MAG TPA: hypothetical protein VN845_06530, partial [Solirubrobacteraceae bacterium]|nr:hypothetical protein [Solirubrobacteraceae bacterium]